MEPALRYAWEKFHAAIRLSATSAEPLPKRLHAAFTGALSDLLADELPRDLREDFAQLRKRAERWWAMTDQEAEAAIGKVVSLHDAITRRMGDEAGPAGDG